MSITSSFFYKPLRSPKVTVWCGMRCNRLYGPFFFEDAQTGNACTVTTETYLGMLETVMDVDITPDIWFQQDGASTHTSIGNCLRLVKIAIRKQGYFASYRLPMPV